MRPVRGSTRRAPVLVIGTGNPSRGDDAIGPLAIDRLAALGLPDVELLVDFQLQVEHALDVAGRDDVIFVDASIDAAAPFTFEPVAARADESAMTHALSPSAVLDVCARIDVAAPPAHVLAVRGYEFELGAALSPEASQNLDAAVAMLAARLARASATA